MFNNALLSVWVRLQQIRNEAGQGLTEYALILALLVIVSVLVLKAIGVDVFEALDKTQSEMPTAPTPEAPTAG